MRNYTKTKAIVAMYVLRKNTSEIAIELEISKSGVREILNESYEKMRKIIEKSKNINFF